MTGFRQCLALPITAAVAFPVLLTGCTSIGSERMGIDRSDYADRLRETNKEELLRNIVGMRYGDAPLFLEVTSVISQYTREGSVRSDLTIAPPPDDSGGSVGGSVVLRETPTITYTPLSGDRFARSMLSPIPPAALLGMVEAGWTPEVLMRVAARSINDVDNGSEATLFAHPADPDFERVIGAMGRLHRSGAIAFHVERDGERFVARARLSPAPTAQDESDMAFLIERLGLAGGQQGQFAIVFGGSRNAPDQLSIGTRSMFEIFAEMADGVELPGDPLPAGPALVRIQSAESRPGNAHVAVRQRGRWFWIDADDEKSKLAFLVAQVLLSLGDTSGGANAPLVTIPTG
ncbi:MAG TPA: hypothetical protein VI168_04785 [Croceibacterium sp.]